MQQKYLPKQMKLFCENNQDSIVACDWYLNENCPETCAFAIDIKESGVGGLDLGTAKRIKKNIENICGEGFKDY